MNSMSKRSILKTLAVATVLALGAGAAAAAGRYVLISHAPDSDSWWNTIKNAIKQAGEDFDVQVDYRNPPSGDLADMSRLIEQAAAQNYDGVITSIADYNVLKGSIKKVTDKKIPLITINSGTTKQSEELGAIMHVGQPEFEAGKGAGERAKAAGIKSFLCVNHYATNPASFERCRGFAEAIGADFKKSTLDSGDDPSGVEAKVSAWLRQNPNTQAVLALGPLSASPSMKAIDKMGLKGKIWFATFDLSDDIARGIKDGSVQFAIDQQPYLQGYMAITQLYLYKKNGNVLGGGQAVLTGPSFVDKTNIAQVLPFIKNNTR